MKTISGFNGLRLDPVSGYYHPGNGYRSYNPSLMRFTAPDSWSPFGAGGMNAYGYCAGDPINRADPSGHFSWQAALGIGMGVLGVVGALFTGGSSLIAVGGLEAAMASASATTMLIGTANLVADISGIASIASAGSNPRASTALGWLSFASGLLSPGAGLLVGGSRLLRSAAADGAMVSDAQHFELIYGEPSESLLGAGNSKRQSWEQARAWIDDKNNFFHYDRDYSVGSKDLQNRGNNFSNTFERKKWTFHHNYREIKDVPYYASDVAKYQYEFISKKYNFFGEVPETIERTTMTNERTLAMTDGKSGQELFDSFFRTETGKSTLRIMSEIKPGLTAYAVERRVRPADDYAVDFIVRLNPMR
ncbi:RHS repeat-associated core domain-containing protein [Winslowiella iniecta]|uniref:RHS repeat-associated core domain-containing protein n=1 Tax=Winslowiella iniecta TaxID=1560201 RepID=UPI00069FF995|nr:RHS repeat-associated core domain-containing protein [Winslowiella iniecta]